MGRRCISQGVFLPGCTSLVLIALFAIGSCSAPIETSLYERALDPENPLRILFIGNSYTFYNDMPYMLEKLAEAAHPPLYVQTEMVAEGGESLRGHWERGIAQETIRNEEWDVVFLQGVSSLGYSYSVEGDRIFGYPDMFYEFARRFQEVIAEAGSETFFFSTWLYEGAQPKFIDSIDYAYMAIASELEAGIAPVGKVWREVLKSNPNAGLYNPDRSHPSSIGSYLTATVIYTELFDRNPLALPNALPGPPANISGIRSGETMPDIEILSEEEAKMIQETAWATHQELLANGGYFHLLRPVIEQPILIEGESLSDDEKRGRWIGEMRAYPKVSDGPVAIDILLGSVGNEWNIDITLDFDGTPHRIEADELAITESGLSFVDRNGPNGSVVKYEGSFLGGRIVGIAEMSNEEAYFYAIGSWDAVKQ